MLSSAQESITILNVDNLSLAKSFRPIEQSIDGPSQDNALYLESEIRSELKVNNNFKILQV
jgi:hypothetical protein